MTIFIGILISFNATTNDVVLYQMFLTDEISKYDLSKFALTWFYFQNAAVSPL